MIHPRSALAALLVLLAWVGPANAQAPSDAVGGLAEGEVRKVDKENRRITLKHGPLKNLDMQGMTMAFPVRDGVVLDTVQVGDKVRFLAERVDGKPTVTKLEMAQQRTSP